MATVVNEAAGMDRVVAALKDKQGNMPNAQFARKLGISPVMWGYLLASVRKPGMKFYSSVMREFPDLIPLCLMALAERGNHESEGKNQ